MATKLEDRRGTALAAPSGARPDRRGGVPFEGLNTADFHRRAACRGMAPSVFFEEIFSPRADGSDGRADVRALRRARAICTACPVRTECHASAMRFEKGLAGNRRFGIFGGLTPLQRHSLWRRGSWWCRGCGEVYDPLGVVSGDVVCQCCRRSDLPVSDGGDQWYPRHDALLRLLVTWVRTNTRPGDRLPPPYRMLELLGYRRKDDMPLLYEHLIHDGLLTKGPHKGEYYRTAEDAELTE